LLVAASTGAGAADVIKFGIYRCRPGRALGHPPQQATELIFDEINSQGELEVGGKVQAEVVACDHKYVIAEGGTVSRLTPGRGEVHLHLGGAVVKANEEA
jgi:hypothetical protein